MTESTAVVDIKKQMMADAETQMTEVVSEGSSNTISTAGKMFSLGDLELGEELTVVIIGSVFENTFYDRQYSPDEVVPPACFAIHEIKNEMVPHPDSPDPQSDTCAECPQNEWESAATGRGKACANKRKLALFAYDDDGMKTDQMVQIRISPTGLKRYNSYIKSIVAKMQRPAYGVVTKLAFDQKQTYPTLTFECVGEAKDDEIVQVFEAKKLVDAMLQQGYDCSEYEPPRQKTRKKSKMS